MTLNLGERHAQRLAARASTHGIPATTHLHPRHGWIVHAITPFHAEPVILRDLDDIAAIREEVLYVKGQQAVAAA